MAAETASSVLKSVLINAVSIKEGGSAVVLDRLLREINALAPAIEWHVAVNPAMVATLPRQPSVKYIAPSGPARSPVHLAHWYEIELPRLIDKLRPDVLFSHTNYLPLRRLKCPTLLLIQNAGHFSHAFEQLVLRADSSPIARLAWHAKQRWVHSSIFRATRITVQTQAMVDAIVERTRVPSDRLTVIGHGPGMIEHSLPAKTFPSRRRCWRVGYITKFGVQKNFSTLLRALQRVRSSGRDVRLVLTLPRAAGFAALEPLIDQLDLGAAIENLTDLPVGEVSALYAGLDAFVFPSICESLGFPQVEAMASGLPLIVADTPNNREVTAGAALYFSPLDDRGLAEQLEKLMSDRLTYEKFAALSCDRAPHFSWRETARQTLTTLHQLSAGSHE